MDAINIIQIIFNYFIPLILGGAIGIISTKLKKDKKKDKKQGAADRFAAPLSYKKQKYFSEAKDYTLNRNSTTSPSLITYSFPSERTRPFSLAAL